MHHMVHGSAMYHTVRISALYRTAGGAFRWPSDSNLTRVFLNRGCSTGDKPDNPNVAMDSGLRYDAFRGQ